MGGGDGHLFLSLCSHLKLLTGIFSDSVPSMSYRQAFLRIWVDNNQRIVNSLKLIGQEGNMRWWALHGRTGLELWITDHTYVFPVVKQTENHIGCIYTSPDWFMFFGSENIKNIVTRHSIIEQFSILPAYIMVMWYNNALKNSFFLNFI